MSIFRKLVTLVRGTAREAGEAVVDANAIRILEQELRDAKSRRTEARSALTDLMSQQMAAERKAGELAEQIADYERHAKSAHDRGDAALVEDVIARITALETEQQRQQQTAGAYAAKVDKLKARIRHTEQGIAEIERELHMVKATESVQRAETALSDSVGDADSSLGTAMDSLERIKRRQQSHEDRRAALDALGEDNADDLDARLAAAGISEDGGSDADAVRKRLGL